MLHLMRACAALAAAVAIQSGCSWTGDADRVPSSPSVEQSSRTTDREVVFLPPVGATPAVYGDIVVDAMPTVVAEQVDPADGTTVTRVLATWTRDETGSDKVQVHLQTDIPDGDGDPTGYFAVRFKPKDFGLVGGELVRFRVSLDGSDLGSADLTVLDKKAAKATLLEYGYVAANATLQVAFRVDRVAADTDQDFDGVSDGVDDCPATWNPDQTDTVGDGVGDACRCDTVTCGEPDDGCVPSTCGETTGECSAPYCIDDHPALMWGNVVGYTFGPLTGATIAITSDTTGEVITTSTAADGTFSIEIPFADSELRISKQGFDDHTNHLHFSPGSMAEDYAVLLQPNVATYDVVVWGGINEPLPGAQVSLDFDGGAQAGGVTDLYGQLVLTGLPIGVGFDLLVTGPALTFSGHQDPLDAGYNSVLVGLYENH